MIVLVFCLDKELWKFFFLLFFFSFFFFKVERNSLVICVQLYTVVQLQSTLQIKLIDRAKRCPKLEHLYFFYFVVVVYWLCSYGQTCRQVVTKFKNKFLYRQSEQYMCKVFDLFFSVFKRRLLKTITLWFKARTRLVYI